MVYYQMYTSFTDTNKTCLTTDLVIKRYYNIVLNQMSA